ncbi:MAG: hypothetical protein LBQ28_05265 [Prevotellaceae bacterium]|jgi:hypothetical protein|nr:hypothetical protein [Prevotellaceae bacterium]
MKKKLFLMLVSLTMLVSACNSGAKKSSDATQNNEQQTANAEKTDVAEPVSLEMTVMKIIVNGFMPGSNNPNINLIEGEFKEQTVKTEANPEKWFDGTYSSLTMPEGQKISVDALGNFVLGEGSHLLYQVIFDGKKYEVKLETGMILKYELSPEGYAKIIYDEAYCKPLE